MNLGLKVCGGGWAAEMMQAMVAVGNGDKLHVDQLIAQKSCRNVCADDQVGRAGQ